MKSWKYQLVKQDWKFPAKTPLTYDLMFWLNNDLISG